MAHRTRATEKTISSLKANIRKPRSFLKSGAIPTTTKSLHAAFRKRPRMQTAKIFKKRRARVLSRLLRAGSSLPGLRKQSCLLTAAGTAPLQVCDKGITEGAGAGDKKWAAQQPVPGCHAREVKHSKTNRLS